jgi:hypothetical protein
MFRPASSVAAAGGGFSRLATEQSRLLVGLGTRNAGGLPGKTSRLNPLDYSVSPAVDLSSERW